jgi:hypothetical protein
MEVGERSLKKGDYYWLCCGRHYLTS